MAEPAGPPVGTLLDLDVGAAAHGGSCVARLRTDAGSTGRVVFVRHTLPGERVRARVTEDRGSYLFADALEVLQASPDRVAPPCPYAGPGRCGGCDWQHAAGPAQRALKRDVVCEQFRRLAGIDVSALLPEVHELPGGLLGWRTRTVYAVDADGRPGLRRHRSHQIEHLDRCLIGAPGVGDSGVLAERWPGLIGVEVARGSDGAIATLAHRPGAGRHPRGRRPPDRVEGLDGPRTLRHHVLGHEFRVAAGGFWQVHPAGVDAFTTAVLTALQPAPGERVLDLYAGAGALSAALAAAVGRTGSVLGIEVNRQAVEDAAGNLADLPQARVQRARVSAATLAEVPHPVDLVVLDPPRAGAGRAVMDAIIGLLPRAVGYVACDPAALARDVSTARQAGWRLTSLSAFDAFPMTAHVECIAALEPDPEAPR